MIRFDRITIGLLLGVTLVALITACTPDSVDTSDETVPVVDAEVTILATDTATPLEVAPADSEPFEPDTPAQPADPRQALADALAARDFAALEALMSPQIAYGPIASDGFSGTSSQFIAALRDTFMGRARSRWN